jgi:hypothetical protein
MNDDEADALVERLIVQEAEKMAATAVPCPLDETHAGHHWERIVDYGDIWTDRPVRSQVEWCQGQ